MSLNNHMNQNSEEDAEEDAISDAIFDQIFDEIEKHMEFFQLLEYSNELEKNKKLLVNENTEDFKVLLDFLSTIEDNLHYAAKAEYIKLAKDFLAHQIAADDFSYSFMAIYEGINSKLCQMARDESLDLGNFLEKSRRPQLGRLLARIYGACDSLSPDPDFTTSDHKELKNYAQILLLKLQEE